MTDDRVFVAGGLDLSLRATGMAAIPNGWKRHWHLCQVHTFGIELRQDAGEKQKVERNRAIAAETVAFCQRAQVSHLWVLGYAFNADQSRAHAAGELGGVVKLALVDAGIPFAIVVESKARTMLGKLPATNHGKGKPKPEPGYVKRWAHQRLDQAGCPFDWDADQRDAFVAANWGLYDVGGDGLLWREQQEMFR